MASKRQLVFSPSGHTPQSKKTTSTRRSGPQSKLIQQSLEFQLSKILHKRTGGRVWLGELLSRLQLSAVEAPTSRSVIYAVKSRYPCVTYSRGVFKGVICTSLAEDGIADIKQLPSSPSAIPRTPPTTRTTPSSPEPLFLTTPQSPLLSPVPELDRSDPCGSSPNIYPCDCIGNTIRCIQSEMELLASKSHPSLLRSSDIDLDKLKLEDLLKEFETKAPILKRVLFHSVSPKRHAGRKLTSAKATAVITALCKVACIYNKDLNAYQKLFGLILRTSGTSKRAINKASRLYDSVSYSTLTKVLDSYASESKQLLNDWSDAVTIHCGDNLDVRSSKRHEGGGISYHDVHLYNNMLYRSRIDVQALSCDIPRINLDEVDYGQFLLSSSEEDQLLDHMKYHIRESWEKSIGGKFVSTATRPSQKYPNEAKAKTQKLHLGVLCKSEQKTGEMLDILQYCSDFPNREHQHQPKIPYRGDVGTYKVAKKALSIADPALNIPFIPCIGAFHLQMEWVQTIFDVFYDDVSARDPEGLAALKVVANAKQVIPKQIRKNYYAATHFLDKVLDSLLLEAANNIFGADGVNCQDHVDLDGSKGAEMLIESTFQTRQGNLTELPSDRCPVCERKYKDYRTLRAHIVNIHSETFVLEGFSDQTHDSIVAHSHQLLNVLLLKRCLDFAIKSADGQFLTTLMKHMMLYFHKHGCRNYALACFEHVAQCQLYLSPQARELVQQECFVNTRGGPLNNMPMDLHLEHSNKFFKEHFTLKSHEPSQAVLSRLSLAQDKLEVVLEQFGKEFGLFRHTRLRHMAESEYYKDVYRLQQHLNPRQVFTVSKPGRALHSTKLMKAGHDPRLVIDMFELKQWFVSSLRKVSDQRFLK